MKDPNSKLFSGNGSTLLFSPTTLEELKPVHVIDEKGSVSEVEVTSEQPLTVCIDKHEFVALVTPLAAIRNC